MKFRTKAIHIGNKPNFSLGGFGDVVVPIHLSTTFARKKVFVPTAGFDYSRSGNPTRAALEKTLAALENGKYGLAFSSGMSAITNVLLLLKPGDHVVAIDNLYGGTHRIFTEIFTQWGITFSLINFTRGEELKGRIRKNTKFIWLESPTNPLLKIIDLASVARFAKQNNITTVIDNTFATPYLQKPLDLGIDIVVHSATKYLGGHSDVIAGCVMTNSRELGKRLAFLQNAVGSILSPFDSYSLLKGIKTLAIRMETHQKNAREVVAFLANHKKVKRVYYPGLASHKGHTIAKAQMTGFGGMVSFEPVGTITTTIKFLQALKIIYIAVSLGAVESLIEHPATMTHFELSKQEREKIGISDTLIRLSVGIEDVNDLIADLSQALEKI